MQAIASGSEGAAASISAVRSAADVAAAGGASAAAVERLALLSALRHEDRAGDAAAAAGGGGSVGPLTAAAVAFGGARQREEDLFGGGLLGNMKRMMGGGSEEMSAYMQHVPLLKQQLEMCADGKLDAKKYPIGAWPRPCLGGQGPATGSYSPVLLFTGPPAACIVCQRYSAAAAHSGLASRVCTGNSKSVTMQGVHAVGQAGEDALAVCRRPATHVVVVMVGGATYTESDVVRRFNAARRRSERRCTALLGSSTMLAASTFVQMLRQQADSVQVDVQ